MDGKLHLLSKDQIAEIVREKSLMPKVEATPEEMRNLVAYLSRLVDRPECQGDCSRPANWVPAFRSPTSRIPSRASWPTYDGNMSGNRFSPLDQINTANVAAARAAVDVPGSAARRARFR